MNSREFVDYEECVYYILSNAEPDDISEHGTEMVNQLLGEQDE